MMDRWYHFRLGRIRYAVLLRAWWASPYWMWRDLVFYLRHGWGSRTEIVWSNTPRLNGECYCPEGSTTDFRLSVCGLGFWLSVSRAWQPQPCCCTKVVWLLYPQEYQEDIEAYGVERLKAEFPDAEPIRLEPLSGTPQNG